MSKHYYIVNFLPSDVDVTVAESGTDGSNANQAISDFPTLIPDVTDVDVTVAGKQYNIKRDFQKPSYTITPATDVFSVAAFRNDNYDSTLVLATPDAVDMSYSVAGNVDVSPGLQYVDDMMGWTQRIVWTTPTFMSSLPHAMSAKWLLATRLPNADLLFFDMPPPGQTLALTAAGPCCVPPVEGQTGPTTGTVARSMDNHLLLTYDVPMGSSSSSLAFVPAPGTAGMGGHDVDWKAAFIASTTVGGAVLVVMIVLAVLFAAKQRART